MLHPLVNNLNDLTEPQLETKIYELQRKYFQTSNPDLQHQITIVLDVYREELNFRRAKSAAKQKEEMAQDGKNLDNLINIS